MKNALEIIKRLKLSQLSERELTELSFLVAAENRRRSALYDQVIEATKNWKHSA